VVDVETMTPDVRQRYVAQSTCIAVLFCEQQAFEGAIDVAENLLRGCYSVENFQDIGNKGVLPVYGSPDDIAEALTTYCRCSHFQASILSNSRRDMQSRADSLGNMVSDLTQQETSRRKTLSGQRLTAALRKEDDEHYSAFLKKTDKMRKELAELDVASRDNTNQLRWMRRRASTAGLAARHLLDLYATGNVTTQVTDVVGQQRPAEVLCSSAKMSDEALQALESLEPYTAEHMSTAHTRTLTRLHSCMEVFDKDPDSKWGLLRQQIKDSTGNPLDCHDESSIQMGLGLLIDIQSMFKVQTQIHKKVNTHLSSILGVGKR